MLTVTEFGAMLNRMASENLINSSLQSQLRTRFRADAIPSSSTPIANEAQPGHLTNAELQEALDAVASLLTSRQRKALLAETERTRLKQQTRTRLRDDLRKQYEFNMRRMAVNLDRSGDVEGWHAAMIKEQRSYILRQMTAGLGRPLNAQEREQASQLAHKQGQYLHRFAEQVATRLMVGNPFSPAYLVNRHLQYGGMGWGAWFRGNNISQARGDGYVVKYIAIDDPRTCHPCHEAAGSYLPDDPAIPYPGEVCDGHGYCRCKHEVVFDMDAWRQLRSDAQQRLAQLPPEPPVIPSPTRAADGTQLAGKTPRIARSYEVARPSFFDTLDKMPKPVDWENIRAFVGVAGEPQPIVMRRYRAAIGEWLDQQKSATLTDVKEFGMSKAEEMKVVQVDGVQIHYNDFTRQAAIDTLIDMYAAGKTGRPLPKKLWAADTRIIFTGQANKDDANRAKEFGMSTFTSAASAADGLIVVYKNRPMKMRELAHESAHNLAWTLYGSSSPLKARFVSEWPDAMKDEKGVTDYANVNIQEDFAESFQWYVNHPEKMKVEQPKRYDLITRILAGEAETAAASNARIKAAAKARAERQRLRDMLTDKESTQPIAVEDLTPPSDLWANAVKASNAAKAKNPSRPFYLEYGTAIREQIEKQLGDTLAPLHEQIATNVAESNALEALIDANKLAVQRKIAQEPSRKQELLDAYMITAVPMGQKLDELYATHDAMAQRTRELVLPFITLPKEAQKKVFSDSRWMKKLYTKEEDLNQFEAKRDAALSFYQKVIAHDGLQIEFQPDSSGRASSSGKVIKISRKDDIRTFVHEMGHTLETFRAGERMFDRNAPNWWAARKAWYDSRTKGEEPESLAEIFPGKPYGSEETKKDKFINPYMGKVYDHDAANSPGSEIIAMATEMLYDDPTTLLSEDPEMFDFIISYLHKQVDAAFTKVASPASAETKIRLVTASPIPTEIEVDLPYHPSKASVKKATSFLDKEIIPRLAFATGFTSTSTSNEEAAKEVEKAVVAGVRKFVDDQQPRIRRSIRSAPLILEDGRFKTQFETGRSGGTFGIDDRRKAELNGMGVPEDIDDKLRPIYGYYKTPTHQAKDFGDVEYVFKKSVVSRTTITVGDSLYSFGVNHSVASPALQPAKEMIADAKTAVNMVHGDGDISDSYIEAQIHGGVTLEDVDYIILHRDPRIKKELNAIAKAYRAKGFRVEFTDDLY
jgi:hypothetical protein